MSPIATVMSGRRVRVEEIYAALERAWKPVVVKIEMEVFVLPFGAVTAGIRLGARRVIIEFGRAVNVCSGDVEPG